MYKLFTLQEANHMIPTVDRHLRAIQTAAADVSDLRMQLERLHRHNLESRNLAEEIAFLTRLIEDAKAELDRLGVQVRDLQAGIVDFPSQLGAEIVCLSWKQGTREITHYHRLNDSDAKPLAQSPQGPVRVLPRSKSIGS